MLTSHTFRLFATIAFVFTLTQTTADAQLFVDNVATYAQSSLSGGPTHFGINTNTPAYELDINGTINASQIRQNGLPIGIWKPYGSHIFYAAGNVGIGQTSEGSLFPSANLHVLAECTEVGFKVENQCELTQGPVTVSNLVEVTTMDNAGNSVDALTIDRTGQVGIGTDDPQADIDFNGDIKLNSASAQNGYVLSADVNGNSVWADPFDLLNTGCGPQPVTDLPIQYAPICHSDAVELGANGTNRLYVGGRTSDVPIAWNAYPVAAPNTGLRYSTASKQAAKISYSPGAGALKFAMSDPDQTVNLGSQVNWENVLVMHNAGAVGIGTDAFDANFKLMVCGSIRAEEIVVETQWCDFVFEDDYELRPLEEVEKFIQENKHLPDIPAGSEVEGQGLKVGEMNARLMLKIEELTLYVIQQQKEINALKQQR